MVVLRFRSAPLVVIFCAAFGAPAHAADNYQTNIGPTPLNGSNRAAVLGRGSVLATLDGKKFTLHGTFAGLATPATLAHLCMGNVMGGTGPILYDVTVSQAQSGEVSGTVMLTPEHNPEGYQNSAPRFAAKNLHGNLLLLHGTIDDNVHLQNTIQFVYELEKAGKQFRMLLYPKSKHGVSDPALVKQMRTAMLGFLRENLVK